MINAGIYVYIAAVKTAFSLALFIYVYIHTIEPVSRLVPEIPNALNVAQM